MRRERWLSWTNSNRKKGDRSLERERANFSRRPTRRKKADNLWDREREEGLRSYLITRICRNASRWAVQGGVSQVYKTLSVGSGGGGGNRSGYSWRSFDLIFGEDQFDFGFTIYHKLKVFFFCSNWDCLRPEYPLQDSSLGRRAHHRDEYSASPWPTEIWSNALSLSLSLPRSLSLHISFFHISPPHLPSLHFIISFYYFSRLFIISFTIRNYFTDSCGFVSLSSFHHLFIYKSIHTFIYPSIHPSIYLSLNQSIHLFIYISIHPLTHLSICPCINLSGCVLSLLEVTTTATQVRKLEIVIATLVFVMAACYIWELFYVKPPPKEVVKGLFVPRLNGNGATGDAIALLGALVMP